jgi:GMP synthase-like glutamine amidotransferase
MIAILNCDVDESEETNGAHLIKRIIPDSTIIDLCRGETITDIGQYSGFVITGSRAGVHDTDRWIEHLMGLIRQIRSVQIPTLGICFGMQAVAHATGGKVMSNTVNEEGFMQVNLKCEMGGLFEGMERETIVYQLHHDAVTELTRGAEIIAQNNACIQGFRLDNIHCIQFHPEIDARTAILMAQRDNIDTKRILNGVRADYHVPERVIENFLTLAKSRGKAYKHKP